MVYGAQVTVPFKMPTAVGEYTVICPSRDDFGEVQIVSVLVMRLRDQLALQPCHAAFQQRRRNLARTKSREIVCLKLIVSFLAQNSWPELLPTFTTIFACARQGTLMAKLPEARTSSRV